MSDWTFVFMNNHGFQKNKVLSVDYPFISRKRRLFPKQALIRRNSRFLAEISIILAEETIISRKSRFYCENRNFNQKSQIFKRNSYFLIKLNFLAIRSIQHLKRHHCWTRLMLSKSWLLSFKNTIATPPQNVENMTLCTDCHGDWNQRWRTSNSSSRAGAGQREATSRQSTIALTSRALASISPMHSATTLGAPDNNSEHRPALRPSLQNTQRSVKSHPETCRKAPRRRVPRSGRRPTPSPSK